MPDHRAPTKPNPAHSLYFACIPSDEVKGQIADAWRSTGTSEKLRRDTLHLSIQAVASLADLDPVLVERARSTPPSLRTASFELCFDRLMTFGDQPGKRALVLATDGRNNHANDMAIELHGALRAVGIVPPRRRKVLPHLTLAYGHGFAETRCLAEPIHWMIRDITLIDSLQGQGCHVSLGTWPLQEGRQHPSFDF